MYMVAEGVQGEMVDTISPGLSLLTWVHEVITMNRGARAGGARRRKVYGVPIQQKGRALCVTMRQL